MRQGWLLLVSFVLLLLAASIDLPVGKALWGKKWPEAKPGLDTKGGTRVILQARIDGKEYAFWSDKDKKEWPQKRSILPGILERRLKGPFGASEATVVVKGDDQFIVELPGITNTEEVLKTLLTTARLEFWWAKNVKNTNDPNRPYVAEQGVGKDGGEEWNFTNPETKTTLKSGTLELKQMVKEEWFWDEVGKPVLDGGMLQEAKAEARGAMGAVVELKFNDVGTKRLADFSRQVYGKEEVMAIMLDNAVISFPHMKAVITDGSAVIEGGNMTAKEAKRLEVLLRAGALPVDLERINMIKVEPTIGSQALDMIIKAGLIGFIIIALFMISYYLVPGVLAVVALVCYSIYSYAVFKLMGVTFSLAGIAGFLLSIGMAVDANVLIFERMKEELRAGKTLLAAIDAGFKRAFTAIFDSNACTVITCLILYNYGTGPVKGFAATLGIGVAISLFTAITLTRMLLYLLVGKGGVANPKLFGLGRQWMSGHGKNLQIVKRMGIYFAISLAVLIPGIVFLFAGGFKPNIEFSSGTEVIYLVKGEVTKSNAEISKMLEGAGLTENSVQIATLGSGDREVIVRLRELKYYPKLKDLGDFDKRVAIAKALAPIGVSSAIIETKRTVGDQEIVERKVESEESFSEVGNVISAETIQNASISLVVAISLILVYLSIRFAIEGGWSGVKFGASALVATIHDVGVVVGAAAIFGYFMNWEVSSLFITAVLTIIGFSVHDTIVIFDRIRENLRLKKRGETFEDMVDRSVTQSFARSINTSLTVILMLTCLLWFGSAMPDLKHFNALMLIGVISGTYSSIYNASPVLVLIERMSRRMGGKTLEEAVKEREKKPVAPKIGPGQEGDRAFGQTGRSGAPPTATEDATNGTDQEPHDRPGRPKSKKPKRRF